MTRTEFQAELDFLAASLENALTQATTRVEHVRVAQHAAQARRLADLFRSSGPTVAAQQLPASSAA